MFRRNAANQCYLAASRHFKWIEGIIITATTDIQQENQCCNPDIGISRQGFCSSCSAYIVNFYFIFLFRCCCRFVIQLHYRRNDYDWVFFCFWLSYVYASVNIVVKCWVFERRGDSEHLLFYFFGHFSTHTHTHLFKIFQ